MQIIAGKYARRTLLAPEGKTTRPPLSRLRRSLFDTLQPYIGLGPYLDLFAGSGSFAFEALSRGAPKATLIDRDRQAIQILHTNLQKVGVTEPVEIFHGDTFEILPRLASEGRRFGLIAGAPPYFLGFERRLLDLLDTFDLLLPEGLVFVQHPPPEDIGFQRKNLSLWKTKKDGNTSFSFFFPSPSRPDAQPIPNIPPDGERPND